MIHIKGRNNRTVADTVRAKSIAARYQNLIMAAILIAVSVAISWAAIIKASAG